MRLLILGGSGMAGHLLVRFFSREPQTRVVYTTRRLRTQNAGAASAGGADGSEPIHRYLDVTDPHAVLALLENERPDAVINAIGILNEDAEAQPLLAYQVNGLLPHWLAHGCDRIGARLVQISSDCVFSGNRGGYGEDEAPDGLSVYARSKALGEVRRAGHLTIRTSIVGPEIRQHGVGLMHWFLRQRGVVQGYRKVLWNGVTTLELAKAVKHALQRPELDGLVHLTAAERVSKYELLHLFREHFCMGDLRIEPSDEPVIDRTLERMRTDWSYVSSDYGVMLEELVQWMRQ